MKKSQNILRTGFLVLFLSLIISFPIRSIPPSASGSVYSYSEMVKLYKRYFALQEDLFKKLTFKLSADQAVKGGTTFKLTLEDNYGRKWIFKEKGWNRVIAYRLYTLFNIEAPEVHKLKIVLNGKPVWGTLQEFIPAKSNLDFPYPGIAPSGLDYMMRTQALDWLMRDHDPNRLNFLVLSFDREKKADKLMRVDQDCACLDVEGNYLNTAHMVAVGKDPYDFLAANNYYQLEEAYKKGEIDLDLKGSYAFVEFVADLPQKLLEEVIWPLRKTGKNPLNGKDVILLKKKYAFFWNSLTDNQNNMKKGFKDLYLNMASSRKTALKLTDDGSAKRILDETCDNFHRKIGLLLEEEAMLRNVPAAGPAQISAVASLDGFHIMKRIYKVAWSKKEDLPVECREALKNLAGLRETAGPEERKAIDLYIREIENIQAGHVPSYPPNQINKLTDPPRPQGQKQL